MRDHNGFEIDEKGKASVLGTNARAHTPEKTILA